MAKRGKGGRVSYAELKADRDALLRAARRVMRIEVGPLSWYEFLAYRALKRAVAGR